MAQAFDVVVIGAGPAGYIAAIRAAQLGLKTACIDEWKSADGEPALGGTCLNVGCIPSKALLESSENYEHALKGLADHGIAGHRREGRPRENARRARTRSSRKMTTGIETLFSKNKITWLKGHGKFAARGAGGWQIEVERRRGGRNRRGQARHHRHRLEAPRHLPGVPVDNKLVCDNVGALAFNAGAEAPRRHRRRRDRARARQRVAAARLEGDDPRGVAGDSSPPPTRPSRRRRGRSSPRSRASTSELGVKIGKVDVAKKGVVGGIPAATARTSALECDRLIVSIGRVPNTDGLGRRRRAEDRRARLHRGRRSLPHQPAERLRDRRRGARPDARAQGRGGGRDGGRAHRRPEGARQPRRPSPG